MAELRPTTNLVVPESLQLDKQALQSNFFYIYRALYSGPEILFMTKLWACSLLPSIGNDKRLGSVRQGIRKATKFVMDTTPAGYLTIKKVMGADPYFRVSVPLFAFNKNSQGPLSQLLEQNLLGYAFAKEIPESTPEHHQNMTELQQRLKDEGDPTIPMSVEIPASRVISSISGLDARAKVALQACLLGIRVKVKGGLAVIYADFKISKEEAQQLTSTHWIELRDIDLYPMLLQWVTTGFGSEGLAPFVAFPISKIAATLPKSHTQYARINKDGISITPKGRPVYLPKELNQTLQYEDRYTQAGTRADGSYALVDINEGASAMEAGSEVKQKLPPNIPVLIDWVNNKYSYTNTSGFLEVEDLTRYQAADVSHIRALLQERIVTDKNIARIAALGVPANVHPASFKVLASDVEGFANLPQAGVEDNLDQWFAYWASRFEKDEGHPVTFADISSDRLGYGPFRPIARYFKTIKGAVLSNLDAVYARYSVSYVMENLAWLILVVEYSSDFEVLKAQDRTNRRAATDQGVTKGWVPPSIPLLSPVVGMLPHQIKVRNLLKDSPDFAILPVQAGGGKSVIILTDVLYEIKANRSQPYLILCPGHLVANYVKEIVFFTGGKLNVIAINSYAFVQNGLPRLKAMLEKAPRNTVVVADYDVLKWRQRALCYGTTPTTIFPAIDFLRQFGFGYVALDEAHKVKNDTARTRATMSLITDIPKKRLASGTMAHDSPSDLAMQIATIDPTLFGTRDEFNLRYGAEVQGNRVIAWKPGAQQEIMRKIKSRIVVAGAMRKEWAALLPKKTEWIKGVNLTDAQYSVYNDILDGIIDRIKEDAKKNKALQKFVNPEAEGTDGEEGEDEVKDEDAGEDMANLLKPYLARLEQFMIAPASDILGDRVLKGADRVSPKAQLMVDRVKLHIDKGYPGKVLVFTNYVESAEELYRLAGPELQKMGILYKAGNKDVDGDRFEKDDRIKWMVGVEQSMNEGLNFQFASRLLRGENPWNPGTLEQGDSRINRPELKKIEGRAEIFYDYILANRSIDITKMSRLISKVIAVAKFENTDNPEYESIPDVPIIKMSLDNIQTMNDWEENLTEYNEAFGQYKGVRNDEYEAFKVAYRAAHNGEDPKLTPLTVAETPPDAKLMSRVPYPPGLDLYGTKEAGLVRLDQYLGKPEEADTGRDEEEDEPEVEEGEETPEQLRLKALYQSMKGKAVHTEFGDGILHSVGTGKRVPVDLFSGFTAMVRKSSVFVITRTESSTKDIRNELLKKIGDLPIDTPIDVPANIFKQSSRALKLAQERNKKVVIKKELKKHKELVESLNAQLQFTIVNGFLGISYFVNGEGDSVAKALQAIGFRPDPLFYCAKMPKALRLKRQLDLWQEKGFRPDPAILKSGAREGFAQLYNLLKAEKIKSHKDVYQLTTSAKLQNFYRMEHKPSNDSKMFKPYPLIEDGIAYIALPIQGQTASKAAIKVKALNVVWQTSAPTLSFFGSPQQLEAKIAQITEAGITVSTLMDLTKELKGLKKLSIRGSDKDKDLEV
jgi:hypothetical protein